MSLPKLGPGIFGRGRRSGARSNARPRPTLESLERRDQLADLVGAQFHAVMNPEVRPGSTILLQFAVANESPFGIPESHAVGFYLSSDAQIDRSDRLLHSGRFAPFMPPFYFSGTIEQFVTLPTESDPIWTGSGEYTLGMILDHLDEVVEISETNNANRGSGIDSTPLRVAEPVPPFDFAISGIRISSNSIRRGESLGVGFDVVETTGRGSGTRSVPFVVRLSRDAVHDSEDRVLHRGEVTPFSGGSSRLELTITLPTPEDSFWAGAPARHRILVEVDPDDVLREADETNNRSRGEGVDRAELDIVVVDFDPDSLPTSSHAPGSVFQQFLTGMTKYVGDTVKEYRTYAGRWPRGIDLSPILGDLRSTAAQLKLMSAQVAALMKSGGTPQPFTEITSIDRTSLAWTDRLILGTLSGRISDSSELSSDRGGRVTARAGFDPWNSKQSLKKQLAEFLTPTKEGTAAGLAAVSKLLGGAFVLSLFVAAAVPSSPLWVPGLLAASALGTHQLSMIVRESGKATNRGDKVTTQEYTSIVKSTKTERLTLTYDDSAPKHGKSISPLSTTTETISRYRVETRERTSSTQDEILRLFDEFNKQKPSQSVFRGTYAGNYDSDSVYSATKRQKGKMSITFDTESDGTVTGRGFIEQVTYNQQGKEVYREKNPFTFIGTAVGTSFSGTATFSKSGRSQSIGGSINGASMSGEMGFSNFRYKAKRS
ncbi:MAG: hypothetical protein SFX72_17550 [Isosphaeraceae bacterium]|nr:hypothetical protein [Isosphaeraceae bacterium]